MDRVDIKNTIKAIIVAKKGGIIIDDLQDEFEDIEGCPIPYKEMGYKNLYYYLASIKEIKQKKDYMGHTILTVNDPKVNHLNQLIKQQKPARNKRRSNKRRSGNKFNKDYDIQWRQNCDRNSDFSWSVSSGYKSSSTSFEEEAEGPPTIFINPRHKNKHVREPVFNGSQLIGDDFFLQLAIKNLEVPIWRKSEKSALYSGLCVSGQSIRDCIKRLHEVNSISDRVTIMLGAVDVYKGNSFEQMRHDYKELLYLLQNKFHLSRNSITICTIPPLANLSFMLDFEKTSTLKLFNNFLRQMVYDNCYFDYNGFFAAYNIQDFYKSFTNEFDGINYNYFQDDARYVSGTRQTWVLFNKRGRKIALDLLS